MNATSVLAAQHQAISSIFDELARQTRRHPRARVAARLAEELIAHMAVEEAVFYPAVRQCLGSPGRGDVHADLRAELRRLLSASTAEAGFELRVDALRTIFEAHIGEEEAELFPRIEGALSDDELEALGAEVLASRPPIWIVSPERPARAADPTLRSRVSLPIPPVDEHEEAREP